MKRKYDMAQLYPTQYAAAKKRRIVKAHQRAIVRAIARPARLGYGSVARTRGAAVTGEVKYFDCEFAAGAVSAVTTTWVAGTLVDPLTTINLGAAAVANPLCLFCPTVGAGLNQRIGRMVKCLKVKIRGHISCAPQAAQAAADAPSMIRFILVLDKQSNAGAMTSAMLMRDASAAAVTISSYQNPDNFGRFRVLKDKRFAITNLNLAGSPTANDVVQAGTIHAFKISCNLKGLEVHFNAANGGTVADIIDHSLHFIVATNNAAYAPNLAYYSRVSFKE